ncbi:MAG: alpha/beta-type small acid-soluble spore protein [Dorea sp.]|nr:alpha/beta-type small acid-soluble spore protein [Dorea sp.]MCI9454182.1 alpha/beta-type small acid-soluble spore protein [Dorea sp.]
MDSWKSIKEFCKQDLTSRQNGSVGGYMVKKMIELHN